MGTHPAKFCLVLAAAVAVAIALSSVPGAQAQTKGAAKAAVPPGGCATTVGAIENGRTCAAACNALQWCPIQWCVNGTLYPTMSACWGPSGLCTPKC